MTKPSEMDDAELTKAVAEEVMRWHVDYMGSTAVYCKDVHLVRTEGCLPLSVDRWQPLHRPDHWWMVMEQMRESGYRYIIRSSGTPHEGEVVFFWGVYGNSRSNIKPIGRAVCEAALAAVRGR